MRMLDRIFVYGTLRSAFDNQYSRLLRAEADFVELTTLPGSIFRVDHFPAYRPEPIGEVHGELYRLRDPEKTLRALDQYEGSEFERVIITSAVRDTWIYQYGERLPDNSRITSGDFCA